MTTSARSTGLRLGSLFGPAIFGVTAAGVALPDVTRALRTTPSTAAWVLIAHALALGIATALSGRFADSRGVRVTLLAGADVLVAGAVVCLSAQGIVALVIGRLVLATGSGATSASALVLASSSTPDQRPKVLATFGATIAVFSAGATLAGGAVTEWLTWRLTVVLPVLSVLAVPFALRLAKSRSGSNRPVDLAGAGLLSVCAASFVILIQSSALELPATVVGGLAAALVVSATGLALRVARVPEGFVQRWLVTDTTFLRAMVTGVGVFAGLFGSMYAAPQFLVREHGWSVLSVGAWLLPGAVLGGALSRWASRLPAAGGVLIAATALSSAVLFGLAGLVDSSVLVICAVSLGFAAFASTQVVATGLLSARIQPAQRGGGVALLNLTFFVGGGAGSAAAGALAKSFSLTTVIAAIAIFPLLGALAALTLRHPRKSAEIATR
ncbi:MFS transporter [Kribbella sp. VKM Ac-2568]|uniref:MFS transporter n=1 Tax=Kribbella sp. VKM Ac-2568 TaxID=2512219 RepID=UPI00104C8033|nr:MFS transporter [Kribbella sp. VKM Ac-2568]TCM36170.1 putative MFS family arabinose efflux permease [Kribbella sp. VKM Ac-2568]